MKKVLYASALAFMTAICFIACDDSSSSSSHEIPSYGTEADLPDTCSMEVAKIGTRYLACFENKWEEITDSVALDQFKEDLDEDEIKKILEKLENQTTKPAVPQNNNSDTEIGSSDSEEESSSSSEEEAPSSSSKKKRNSGSGSGSGSDSGSGSGSGDSGDGTKKCGTNTYNPATQFCATRGGVAERAYKKATIKIGTDYSETWMAENLAYEISGNSDCYGSTEAEKESFCKTYGRLYAWYIAVGKTADECSSKLCKLAEGDIQGICPDGWHLPSRAEWDAFLTAVNGNPPTEVDLGGGVSYATAGKKIKANSSLWPKDGQGTDDYNFSALPAGMSGSYIGMDAFFWSSTQQDGSNAYNVNLWNADKAYMPYNFKGSKMSVRCILNHK